MVRRLLGRRVRCGGSGSRAGVHLPAVRRGRALQLRRGRPLRSRRPGLEGRRSLAPGRAGGRRHAPRRSPSPPPGPKSTSTRSSSPSAPRAPTGCRERSPTGDRRAIATSTRPSLAIDRGEISRLAFAVPAPCHWSLPLYELAIMAATHLADMGDGPEAIDLITAEKEPLDVFGAGASQRLRAELDRVGVRLHTGVAPARVAAGGLTLMDGSVVRVRSCVCPASARGCAHWTGWRRDRMASSPPTRECGSQGAPTSTPSAMPAGFRSSRVGSPPSRPTWRRRRSPRALTPTSRTSRFDPSSGPPS